MQWSQLDASGQQLYRAVELAASILEREDGNVAPLWSDIVKVIPTINNVYDNFDERALASWFWNVDRSTVPYDPDDLERRYREYVERTKPKAEPAACSCDIHLLMRSGCSCGAFKREKESKNAKSVVTPIGNPSVAVESAIVTYNGRSWYVNTPRPP